MDSKRNGSRKSIGAVDADLRRRSRWMIFFASIIASLNGCDRAEPVFWFIALGFAGLFYVIDEAIFSRR